MLQKQAHEKYNKSIINNINDASNDVITNIYDKMLELCDEENDKRDLRFQKIKYILVS